MQKYIYKVKNQSENIFTKSKQKYIYKVRISQVGQNQTVYNIPYIIYGISYTVYLFG